MKRYLLLIGAMVFSLVASAEDTRTEVAEFSATSNIAEIMIYDHAYEMPIITMDEGSVARFSRTMTDIQKKDASDQWQYYYNSISEGTYRIVGQVRIDGDYGTQYKIREEGCTVKVDDVEWSTSYVTVADTYSYVLAYSPEIVIEKVAIPLEFNNSTTFNVPLNYIGVAISSYSVTNGVVGGEEPYTFSKTSGPEWIEVSADGTVSGTPTTIGTNEDLVIRVTDNASEYKEITVTVGKTCINPEDRTEVTEFSATSNIAEILVYGHEYESPTITLDEGSVANIPKGMIQIQKMDEFEEWQEYNSTISEGTYRVKCQVRIDGDNGTQYKIGNGCTLIVDGVEWYNDIYIIIYDTYSYFVAFSPEIVIEKSSVDIIGNDIEKASDVYNMQGILVKRNATDAEVQSLPAGLYFKDGRKVLVK